jgi:S-formylglutathione hydrolase FrmB
VLLPDGYDGKRRFPVLFLLHGAGGRAEDWVRPQTGDIANTARGLEAIVVMPEGATGFYTNWWNEGRRGAPGWERFYIDELVPLVERRFRVLPGRRNHAIAGLSMGGFGAVRYAQDRPDLFAYVASFSGAVDLGDSGTRSVVTEQASQNGFNPYGPFGNPFWPFDGTWNALNPLNRAARLQGVGVALYVGSGINDQDAIEGTMAASAARFHNALDAAGVPANLAADGDFESAGLGPWACLGTCGADHGAGLARTGTGNGWVRNSSGWNDLHQTISVAANRTYTVSAWFRTSANNADGYLGLRTTGGTVVGEQRFTRLDAYTKVTATVNSAANTSLVVYAGLWANGDTWAQVDDVTVTAS